MESRGVSPVIGIVLIIAIAVVLAGTVGVFAFGISDETQPAAPDVAFSTEYDRTGASDSITLTVQSGDAVETDKLTLQLVDAEVVSGPSEPEISGSPIANQAGTELEGGDTVTIDTTTTTASGSDLDLSDATVKVIWDPDPETDGPTNVIFEWTAPR
jgi:flagellin-like protein